MTLIPTLSLRIARRCCSTPVRTRFGAALAHCASRLGVSAAAMLLVGPDAPVRLAAASCPHSRSVETVAVATDTGPGVEAAHTGAQVSCSHLGQADTRWAAFALDARLEGFRAAHALPMRHGGCTIGALSLLSTRPRALGAGRRALAQALADDLAGRVAST